MPNEDTSAEQNRLLQRAALALLLSLYPKRLSQGELARILADDPEDAAQRDAVRAALARLLAAGLLRRDDHLLEPSEAALCFDRLMTL